MITIADIHKCFEDQEVLHGINATFEEGKTNLVIGRSGSGKTVLLRCIVGLLTPDCGQVLYDGRDIHRLPKREATLLRQEMGMLFQGAALFDSMNVLDNVLFPLEMFSSKSARERLERARFCLERVGLADAGAKMPSELSGGMQKRVAIARAIALEPRYLFCDEPNSGLDPIPQRAYLAFETICIEPLHNSLADATSQDTILDGNHLIELGSYLGYQILIQRFGKTKVIMSHRVFALLLHIGDCLCSEIARSAD